MNTNTGVEPVVQPEPDQSAGVEIVSAQESAPARPKRWAWLVAGLAMALVVLVVAGVFLLRAQLDAAGRADDRRLVVATASQVASDLVTIGADNAQGRLSSLLDESTGEFRKQLVGFSQAFQAVLQVGKVASDGTVTAAGVESLGDDHAVVLVSMTTTVTNTQIPDGAQRNYRSSVTLDRVDGRWLVSAVEFVA